MIKRIRYVLFGILISLFSFNLVYAQDFELNYNFFPNFPYNLGGNTPADRDLMIEFDKAINAQSVLKDIDFNYCSVSTQTTFRDIICANVDFSSANFSNNRFRFKSIGRPYTWNFTTHLYSESYYPDGYNLDYFSFYDSYFYFPFWSQESFVNYTDVNARISDEVYNSIDENFKKYYNFQDYFLAGGRGYTYFDLVVGPYKNGSVKLNFCSGDDCNVFDSKILKYKYFEDNEIIDLKNKYLFNTYDIYNVLYGDEYDYKITAGVTQEVNIYLEKKSKNIKFSLYCDEVLCGSVDKDIKDSYSDYKVYYGDEINLTTLGLDEVLKGIYYFDYIDYAPLWLNSCELSDYKVDANCPFSTVKIYYKSKDVDYYVDVYLDDIYYPKYSTIRTGKVGKEVILEDLEERINYFNLDPQEYKITLVDDKEKNHIVVNYYSDNYDTKYQDIDTSNKFYISFDWVYIKDLFNLKGNYTQTEQFLIVYVVNFLFYAIVGLVIYICIKLINKILSIFSYL